MRKTVQRHCDAGSAAHLQGLNIQSLGPGDEKKQALCHLFGYWVHYYAITQLRVHWRLINDLYFYFSKEDKIAEIGNAR